MSSKSSPSTHHKKTPELITFDHLRKCVGWIAFLLPVLVTCGYMVTVGEFRLLGSISAYYFTPMRSLFVGALCMVGIFLYAYRGYTRKETILFRIAAGLAVAIALFSMNPDHYCDDLSDFSNNFCNPCFNFEIPFNNKQLLIHRSYFGLIHDFAAGLLFILLGYVSHNLFTRTHDSPDKKPNLRDVHNVHKRNRNRIYTVCGIIIWVSLGIYALFELLLPYIPGLQVINNIHPLLIVETTCLWAFGVSWLVKGFRPILGGKG